MPVWSGSPSQSARAGTKYLLALWNSLPDIWTWLNSDGYCAGLASCPRCISRHEPIACLDVMLEEHFARCTSHLDLSRPGVHLLGNLRLALGAHRSIGRAWCREKGWQY